MTERNVTITGTSIPPSQVRDQRILTFIITLSVLNVPFLLLGLVDLPDTAALIRVLVAYLYYGAYYLLLRAGHGVTATYGCLVLLAFLVASGVHDTGGFLIAITGLYFLLLIGAGTVLNEPRALDVTLVLCLVSYGGLAIYELAIQPPAIFQALYTTSNQLAMISIVVSMLVTLAGVWVVMRRSIAGLLRAGAAQEAARAEAERRAQENEALAAQVQQSNESLLATQARLRETIDALALPIIPLDDRVAMLPLIGYLDDARAERLVAALLRSAHDQRTRHVVLDITGLREVNTHVGATLLQLAQSLRLLGAEVVLSGLSADAAQALVELGADMGGLRTAARLSDALRMVKGIE